MAIRFDEVSGAPKKSGRAAAKGTTVQNKAPAGGAGAARGEAGSSPVASDAKDAGVGRREVPASGHARVGGAPRSPKTKTRRAKAVLVAAEMKAASLAAPKLKGGRPRVIEGEPWVAQNMSKRTWYRRGKP